jgi:dynein heavy chain
MTSKEGGKDENASSAVDWIRLRLSKYYKSIKAEKFDKNFNDEETQTTIQEFIEMNDACCLCIVGESLRASLGAPKTLPKGNSKAIYFVKENSICLTSDNVADEVTVNEMLPDSLNQLQLLLSEVYVPLLTNPANQQGWGEVTSKAVADGLHKFLANVSITLSQTKGETCLPLPPMQGFMTPQPPSANKDRIHLLENAIILWTRQIKSVLKLDPETPLKQGKHPLPDSEISFWKQKSKNLNAIFDQLQSPRVRQVLSFLDQSKSTYCTPFAKLCKEVFTAREEANDNVLFLTPLEEHLNELLSTATDLSELPLTFRPIMHTILLIWKESGHYNTPARLCVLIREICNALIWQATEYLPGASIFQMIEEQETHNCVSMLKVVLKSISAFKSVYFEYKSRATNECGDNPWRIQNNALFMRLDSFLERCHDILDLSSTIVQFSRLEKIEIGGTKGKALTTTVQQTYSDFNNSVLQMQGVKYDIMDVNAKEFDDDFYEFRCKIKELERRLGSVLTQGFDDSPTIQGRFKLLDSFETLLDRPIISDELERKHSHLIESFSDDLKITQEIFLNNKESPPIPVNQPPMSGAIIWCSGLKGRIVGPMKKLNELASTTPSLLEREEAKEMIKMYGSIVESLSNYVQEKLLKWSQDVEQTGQEKLKQSLLDHLDFEYRGYKALTVNFDPGLVRLLREVKYFLNCNFKIPESALQIYEKGETLRRQTGSLDLIVSSYNSMIQHLLPVEEPLVKKDLNKIGNILKRGSNGLTWKSHGIDMFISDARSTVNEASNTLNTLKNNLTSIQNILDGWITEPLFPGKEQASKSLYFDELEAKIGELRAAATKRIKDGANEIHKLVKISNKTLKVSTGLPDWKAYVEFINSIVVGGLTRVASNSLKLLLERTDIPDSAMVDHTLEEQDGDDQSDDDKKKKKSQPQKNHVDPLMDADLSLSADGRVALTPGLNIVGPSIREGQTRRLNKVGGTIQKIISFWIDSMFQPATHVKRLDGQGNYTKEMQGSMVVRVNVNRVNKAFSRLTVLVERYKKRYNKFSYLWELDRDKVFQEFLNTALLRTSESGIVFYNLDLFDQEITKYGNVLAQVMEQETTTEIAWLRVLANPIQRQLVDKINKWKWKFTSHLYDDIVDKLSNLSTFMKDATKGLQQEVENGDKDALMAVMKHISAIRKRRDDIGELFEPLKAAISLLKTHNVGVEDSQIGEPPINLLDFLSNAPMQWDQLVNAAFKKREDIVAFQNSEADALQKESARFEARVTKERKNFRENAPFDIKAVDDLREVGQAYTSIDKFTKVLLQLQSDAHDLNVLEDLFEVDVSRLLDIDKSWSDLRMLKGLYDFRANFGHWMSINRDSLWNGIDTDSLEDMNKRYQKQLNQYGMTNTVTRGWEVFKKTTQQIKNMATVLPLINDLHSDSMRSRHWMQLGNATRAQSDLDPNNPKFSMGHLLDLSLHLYVEQVGEIVETADKELKIERKLDTIDGVWASLQVEYVQHKDTDNKILKVPDEVVEYLDAHQLELQTMIGMGKFVDFFRAPVVSWQNKLGLVETILKLWSNVTKTWASLEAIFLTSEDIRSQLPDDTKRFEQMDSNFKEVMKNAVDVPNVVEVCSVEGLEDNLREMIGILETCQKSLNEYLDMKKKVFPRFYFVSNVALLDILSNGNNPPAIMPYVSDCYDALSKLIFTEGSIDEAHTMIAKDGEQIELDKPFKIVGAVENWLNDLTKAMKDCLRDILSKGLEAASTWGPENPRHGWLFQFPAQVVLQTSLIDWTEVTENSLDELVNGDEDAVKGALNLMNGRINNLIKLVQGKLKKPDRGKIIALITLDVHGREVCERLIRDKCQGPEAFAWQQQLKFYWSDATKDCFIRICDYRTYYSYEYIGNTGRLVITPLTDRCYITLTTALRLMLGGAPAGPAGTGKTETVKDLGRAVALPVYVFNCSDQMNYQTLADIFRGLAQTGGWGCFDEFNRIPIEVLSVVATQVKTIQDAVAYLAIPNNRAPEFQTAPPGQPPCKVGTFDFMGDIISLVPTTGAYITMNPGYAGRTELPENVKACFRSCAMIRPDLAPISEIMLMAEGFVGAKMLSIKFVTLYMLSDDLLSKQAHYDWGLRAVKSVLRVAGTLKRAEPDVNEEAILMRALRDFNTPKIPANDTPIFLRLIDDLFPDYAKNTPPVVDVQLKELAGEVAQASGLQSDDVFCTKVVQFQELLDVRHSVMLLGPAGCGKTEIWKGLAGCHNKGQTKKVCITEVVNPKSVTSDELYGYMTLAKDWKDGVLSIMMRGMKNNDRDLGYHEYQTSKWVVLDGDIDAVWIESMNTVMDDNKVLTLVSNERIPLTPAMRMVFEIDSLANATPATVSRAGILFINESDIGFRPFIDSFVQTRTNAIEKAHLPLLFSKYVQPCLDLMKKEYDDVVPLRAMSKVYTLCYLLQAQLDNSNAEKFTQSSIEKMFVYSMIWSFGGPLPQDKVNNFRRNFSRMWLDTFKDVILPLKEGQSVFDIYYDCEADTFSSWEELCPEYIPPSELNFSKVVVQTAETTALTHATKLLAGVGRPVMLVGGAGTGKTTILQDFLAHLESNSWMQYNIAMNFYTDSKSLQAQLENPIDKRSGHTFGPPSGRKLVYFVDDLNLPYVETYGTQNSLSLMRQLIDHGNFFDRIDLGFRTKVVDVQFVTAMNPTAGSFTISDRLQRQFSTFACMMPSQSDLRTIYHSILDGHLEAFEPRISGLTSALVDSTVNITKSVQSSFLPSAIKFTYNWNMRELSNVVQGLCRADPGSYTEPLDMVRLWYHECNRVFKDRMVAALDLSRFEEQLLDVGKKFFSEVKIGTGMNDIIEIKAEELVAEPCVYTSFVSPSHGEPTYLPIPSQEVFVECVKGKLVEYNESNSIMDLVLFQAALLHVSRIARIVANPAGNAMLIGVGGSGKQSLSKLASFILGYELKQINVSGRYGVEDLKEDLKEMYLRAGVKGIPLVFLLTDTQIIDDQFLIYINGILSTGWIPGLFAQDEMDGIFAGIRNEAKAAGIMQTPEAQTEFFISRVRKYLHLVLCFSPVGDTFRNRARKFPGIINCTCIDYFHGWPREALVSVAQRFLASVDLPSPELRENISHHMAEVHISVTSESEKFRARCGRINYVTPKSFLALIEFYSMLLNEKKDEVDAQITRLATGLATLQATAKDVAQLQEDLKVTMVKVEEKKEATNALLEQMGKEQEAANVQKDMASAEAEKAAAATAIAVKIQTEAEGELAAAKPAMEEAADAVNCLDKASLTELKNFNKPPGGVDLVTKACLLMIEGETRNFKWDRAKKMMSKVDAFLIKLQQYEAKNMTEELIAKLKPVYENEIFSFDVMKGKSSAAANLCKWVRASYDFNRIYVRVKPLMDTLEAANSDKAAAEGQLATAEAAVAKVEKRLGELQKTLLAATTEKMKVEAEAKACMDRLDLANRLVGGLSSENTRWGLEVNRLQESKAAVFGDVLLSAAFVSYIGVFDGPFRQHLVQNVWLPDLEAREIKTSDDIKPLTMLTNAAAIAALNNEGLPADMISVQNGVIIESCTRWPLIIDPQLQGYKWLRSKFEAPPPPTEDELKAAADEKARAIEAGEIEPDPIVEPEYDNDGNLIPVVEKKSKRQDLVVLQLTMKGWARRLSNSIQNGDVVIIENVGETLDPTLDPVLARAVYKKGRNMYLRFGGEEIAFDPMFKLYLTSKLSNPHYSPEILAQTTLINFIATEAGLEDQLLARVVNTENPDLEKQKQKLQEEFNQYKITLVSLEDELLERLANAPEDILSDVPLILGLEATKKTAADINAAIKEGEITEKRINELREQYRPVASEASMLYFMLTTLNSVYAMYQYSLDAFVAFFYKAIRITPTNDDIKVRIASLQTCLRYTIYEWVSRGLFTDHKLIFMAQLTFSLMRRGNIDTELDPLLFSYLIRGPKLISEDNSLEWLPDSAWQSACALCQIDEFSSLSSDMLEAPGRFLEWFNHITPESEKLPLDWSQLEKEPFKKLCVVRALRPDRMTVAIGNFVRNVLPAGEMFADCDLSLNSVQVLADCLKDSNPTTPLYFILSPGADVVADLDKMALEYGQVAGTSYHNISMGQGQDIIAMERLDMAHRSGHWVILNNVHLMPRWLLELEKKLDEFAQEGSDEKFRLFLSSDPATNIPIGILSRCIKIRNEPPTGLKPNLKRAWSSFSRDMIADLESKTKSIVFGLCYFHSILTERKKFGPKGFNMMYPFSLGDLRDSSICLMNYMENAPSKIPWEDLKYIFGQIIYGGHIVNDWDRLLAMTYLDFFMKDDLLDEAELMPFCSDERGVSFMSCNPTSFDGYVKHVDETLAGDTPLAFGLHPNAEIGFRTQQSETMFTTLLELQPQDAGDSGDNDGEIAQTPAAVAEQTLNDIIDRFADKKFDMDDVSGSIDDLGP